MALYFLIPFVQYRILDDKDANFGGQQFHMKFGKLTDGLRTRDKLHQAYHIIMMLRRTFLTGLLFYDAQTGQMLIYRNMMVLMVIYLGHYKPSLDSHGIDLANEIFLLLQADLLAVFTEFVPDAETRLKVGWASVGLLALQILLSMSLLLAKTVKQLFLFLKRCRARKQLPGTSIKPDSKPPHAIAA